MLRFCLRFFSGWNFVLISNATVWFCHVVQIKFRETRLSWFFTLISLIFDMIMILGSPKFRTKVVMIQRWKNNLVQSGFSATLMPIADFVKFLYSKNAPLRVISSEELFCSQTHTANRRAISSLKRWMDFYIVQREWKQFCCCG